MQLITITIDAATYVRIEKMACEKGLSVEAFLSLFFDKIGLSQP